MKKCLFSLTAAILAFAMVFSLTSGALAVDTTYKCWDQGDSRWGSMSISTAGYTDYNNTMAGAGCYIAAMAKILVHAGQQDPGKFTPRECLQGMLDHNMLNSNGEVMYENFNYGFLPTYGSKLSKETSPSHGAWSKATAVSTLSQKINEGYYIIVCVKNRATGNTHYMAVDYVSDDVYVMDNGGVVGLYGSWAYSGGVIDQVYFKYSGPYPYPAYDYTNRPAPAEIQPGLYSLVPACAPDSRLEVAGGSMDIQANVHIGRANGETAQQWEISALGDGYYKLINKKSGHALDVAGAGTTAGTNVQQYWWTENRAQHWSFFDAGDGSYQIATRLNTGLRLDVNGGAATNGTNVQVYTENNSAAQRWRLIPVTSETDDVITTTKKTQYRYHRYIDNNGEYAICPYYGNSTYHTVMHLEYTDWLDAPLPEVKRGYVNYLEHPYQGASCDRAGCIDGATFQVHRHEDASGNVWYYEETRTVAVDKPTTTTPETSKPSTPETPKPSTPETPKPTTPETTPPTPVPVPNCDNGHTWGGWEVVVPATCNDDGQSERVCKVCGEVGVLITEALAHKYSVKQEADTFTLYACVNCGDSYAVEKEKKQEPEQPLPAGDMTHFVDDETYVDGLFSDVKATDWYSANVSAAYGLGLMNGTGGNSFSPTNSLTLGEAVTLAARLHSIYYTGTEDFPRYDGGNWYDPYVDYAREKGIIRENFNYALPATREEFVHILAAALPEAELFPVAAAVTFADVSRIIYNDDVGLLQRSGVISGIRESGQLYFRPGNTITRAEVAAVITRMAKPELRKS